MLASVPLLYLVFSPLVLHFCARLRFCIVPLLPSDGSSQPPLWHCASATKWRQVTASALALRPCYRVLRIERSSKAGRPVRAADGVVLFGAAAPRVTLLRGVCVGERALARCACQPCLVPVLFWPSSLLCIWCYGTLYYVSFITSCLQPNNVEYSVIQFVSKLSIFAYQLVTYWYLLTYLNDPYFRIVIVL